MEAVNPNKVTLDYFLQKGMFEKREEVQEIAERAFKEYKIQELLEEMKLRWESIRFEIDAYKDNMSLMKGFDKI